MFFFWFSKSRLVCFSGIVEPIKSGIRNPKLGIGKQEEDDFFTAEENIQRKKLEIELEENEEYAKNERYIYKLVETTISIFASR